MVVSAGKTEHRIRSVTCSIPRNAGPVRKSNMSEPLIRSVSDTAHWVAFHRATESDRKDHIFDDPYARSLAGERGALIGRKLRENAWAIAMRTYLFDNEIRASAHHSSVRHGCSHNSEVPPIVKRMAAARRRMSSPAPGQPTGNIVNKRCKFSPELPRRAPAQPER